MNKRKVCFIQPSFAHYREPFFEKMNDIFDMSYIFLSKGSTYNQDYKFRNESICTIFLNKERNPKWIVNLILILLKVNADVLISSIPTSIHSYIAFLISILRKKKFIIWTENWNFKYFYITRPKIYRTFMKAHYKYMLKSAKAVIVHGDYSANFHKKLGIDYKNIFVANHCSIDLRERKIANFKKPKFLVNKFVILFFSRIIPRKSLDILIKAFKKIEDEYKNILLLIAGDGSDRINCQKLAKTLKLRNYLFVGNVQFENAHYIYNLADLFVLPSSVRKQSEGWGLVINEAMSMGLPIITTDSVGGGMDLVKNDVNGYIVTSGDVNSLYLALKGAINSNKIDEMKKKSREIFEKFNSFEKMVNGFKNAIDFSLNDINISS